MITLFLTACGGFEFEVAQQLSIEGSDPEFVPYLMLFNDEMKSRGVTGLPYRVVISFDDSLDNSYTLGVCYIRGMVAGSPLRGYTRQIRSVSINKSSWVRLRAESREELIFHELGHCVLGKTHDTSMGWHGGERLPNSIMYDGSISAATPGAYRNNRDYYMLEFWGAERRY